MRLASMIVGGQRRFGRFDPSGAGTSQAESGGGNLGSFAPLERGLDPRMLLDPDAESALAFDRSVQVDAGEPFEVPVPVASVRDFITFEQHTAGSLRAVSGTSDIPSAWFEAPVFYFTNPHALIGSGHPVPVPPGRERLGCGGGGGAGPRSTHRSSTTRTRPRSSARGTRCRCRRAVSVWTSNSRLPR
jgi:hypothetical protein